VTFHLKKMAFSFLGLRIRPGGDHLKGGNMISATRTGENRFEVRCPWCDAEGKRTVVGYTTVEHSFGICEVHHAKMRREIDGLERRGHVHLRRL
jgi:hypothetical protein